MWSARTICLILFLLLGTSAFADEINCGKGILIQYVSPSTGLSVKSCQVKRDGKYVKEGPTLNFDSSGKLVSTQLFKNDVETVVQVETPATAVVHVSPTQSANFFITSGAQHAMAMRNDKSVWAWGRNFFGEFGDSSIINDRTHFDYSSPIRLKFEFEFVIIAAGENFTLGVKKDGSVLAWGDNTFGLLGSGNVGPANRSNTPVLVNGLTNITALAAGSIHAMALKNDQTVWTWGVRNAGLLGHQMGGLQVTDLSNVIAIAAGPKHSVVLKNDGTVWTWGDYTYGQLGDGRFAETLPEKDRNGSLFSHTEKLMMRGSPVQVIGIANVTSIAAGGNHTIALRSDGTVWTWGANSVGQLGNGTYAHSPLPVQVKGLDNVKGIAGGLTYTIALKNDGSVWMWGSNVPYEKDMKEKINTPIQVRGLSEILAISAGHNHSLAYKRDGTIWAWGYNAAGQLGDGTILSKEHPVQIKMN